MRLFQSAVFWSCCSPSNRSSTACETDLITRSHLKNERISSRSSTRWRPQDRAHEFRVYSWVDEFPLPVFRLSWRAGPVRVNGRRTRGGFVHASLAHRNHTNDVRWNGRRSVTCHSIFPPCRRADEFGQRGGARCQSLARLGRPCPWWAFPSRRRVQHVFSEMSGSTTADVAVISRALGGPMKK